MGAAVTPWSSTMMMDRISLDDMPHKGRGNILSYDDLSVSRTHKSRRPFDLTRMKNKTFHVVSNPKKQKIKWHYCPREPLTPGTTARWLEDTLRRLSHSLSKVVVDALSGETAKHKLSNLRRMAGCTIGCWMDMCIESITRTLNARRANKSLSSPKVFFSLL